MMDKKNTHIKEYLDYYCSMPLSPEYAVLIRGKWGSGKSWFIKNYRDNYNENGKKFLYVSLYGISTYQEIQETFFQQLHPKLSSKGMKLAGKILKGLIKTTIKLDFDGDNKDDGSISSGLPDINLPDYLQNTDDKILIFDDLERCSIPIPNILGYINQFVENDGLKVIIIANEDEIIKVDEIGKDKEDAKKYLTIKEKLIGKSFDIHSDLDASIIHFLEQIRDKNVRTLLIDRIELLKTIFSTANYKNLRHLRLSILDFEKFYQLLPKKAISTPSLINHIINLLFTISFELRKGNIIEEEIRHLLTIEYIPEKQTKEQKIRQEIREKYSILREYSSPVSGLILCDFFKYGIVDKEQLQLSIENSKYFQNENTPDWVKLWRYVDLEDEDINPLFQRIYSNLKNLQVENQYELTHIVGVFLTLSNLKIISLDISEFINIAKKNVESLRNNKNLISFSIYDFLDDGSYQHGYQGKEIKEFAEFVEFLCEQSNIVNDEQYPVKAIELLNLLPEYIDHFELKITLTNSSENIYAQVPILSYIPVERFYNTFIKLPNTVKRELTFTLEKRYKYQIPQLKNELEWLEEILSYFSNKENDIIGQPSKYIIQSIFLPSIEKNIERLSKIQLQS